MELNYLAIFVGAIVLMVTGAMWYGPLFGKYWMKLTGMTESDIQKTTKTQMSQMYLFSFISYFLLSLALYVLGMELEKETVLEWAKLGFLVGIFFYGVAAKSSYLWECRPKMLWVLNTLYTACGLALTGVVLALL